LNRHQTAKSKTFQGLPGIFSMVSLGIAGSVVRRLIVSSVLGQDNVFNYVLPRRAQVSVMEKMPENEKMVELENYFEVVWASLWRIGKDVALETEELKTPFVVRARMAKRAGSDKSEEVLVFLKSDASGKLKECSRCYASDWGFYFNHLGIEGQRIGMYCKTIDDWVSENTLRYEID
jgi:hypothetical protein